MSRQSWSPLEDQAITKLVKQHGIEDWTKIAYKLSDYLGMQKRTGKQCRERWYNHLSPTVSKKPWTQQEQELLFTSHKNFGNRWKDISKLFIGRTDNDIKNHFYSTLRRSLRRLNKIVGEKNSTTQMRQIKPSVLSTIMNYIYEQELNAQFQLIQSLKDLPLLIFEFATFKPIKVNMKSTNIELIRDKTNQIFSLITRFNQQYQKNKEFRRNLKSERMRKKSSFHQSYEQSQIRIKIEENSSIQGEQQLSSQLSQKKQKKKDVIKIQEEQGDIFDKNMDVKHLNATEFSMHPQPVDQDFSHHNYNPILTIFQQFESSPKQTIQYENRYGNHQAFSLEADDINDLHFQEPEEPSKLNIEDNQFIRSHNEIDGEKDRHHHAELIDEVIQTHFAS